MASTSTGNTPYGAATASNPGLVSTTTQTFGGDKTFNGTETFSANIVYHKYGTATGANNYTGVVQADDFCRWIICGGSANSTTNGAVISVTGTSNTAYGANTGGSIISSLGSGTAAIYEVRNKDATPILTGTTAGAWTWGPTSGTTVVSHQINSYAAGYNYGEVALCINERRSSTYDPTLLFAANGVARQSIHAEASALYFYAGTTATGGVTDAGAWTFGNSAIAATCQHTFYSYKATDTINAIFINNLYTNYGIISIGGTATRTTFGTANGRAAISNIYGTAADTSNTAVYIGSNNYLNTNTSLRESKKDIQDIGSVLPSLSKLKPVSFARRLWSNDGYGEETEPNRDIGFIAEDIRDDVPEFAEYLTFTAEGVLKGVHADRFPAVLVRAIQEQQAMIEELKAEIQALKGAL